VNENQSFLFQFVFLLGGGSLLAGGLGLDVAVGFCLGGGGEFRRRQWAGQPKFSA
jgi:hypothetical protein